MKFIIDANLPVSLGEALAAAGHDVIDARQFKPSPATDQDIFNRACAEKRVILTRDLDFANIMAYDARKTGGIIILRTFLLPISEISGIVKNLLVVFDEKGMANRLVIVEPKRFRIHTPDPE